MISLCQPGAHRYPLATPAMREAEAKMHAVRQQAHKAIKHRAIHYTTLDLAICEGDHDAALLFSVLRHEQEYFSTKPNYSGFVAATIMPGERCAKSLWALCEGRMGERRLRASIAFLCSLGLLIREDHPVPVFRQYNWRIDPNTTAKAYRRIQRQEAERQREACKAAKERAGRQDSRPGDEVGPTPGVGTAQPSKNAVFSHSDKTSDAPPTGDLLVSPFLTTFSQIATQKTPCFPIPTNDGIIREFFSYRVPFPRTGESSAARREASPVALRALSAQIEPEGQTAPYEDEQGVTLPEVGGEAPQPAEEASPAVMPIEPPAMVQAAPEALIGSAAPMVAPGGQESPSESQAADPATCETPANLGTPSLESGEPSPVAADAGPAEFQTDVEGGAAHDPFLAELLEGEGNGASEVTEAAQASPPTDPIQTGLSVEDMQEQATETQGADEAQEAQEVALLALTERALLRANVSQELRDGASFAASHGLWKLPAVQGLMKRPQRPVAFEEALHLLTQELRGIHQNRRARGTALQLRALDSLTTLMRKTPLLAEPVGAGIPGKRAERWQRLSAEEIRLAVELLPKVHVAKTKDGKKRKPSSTLKLILDVLCGRGEQGEAPGAPTGEAKPTRAENPVHLAELARKDRERLLQSEREAEERHAAEQAALLASEPETQWEQACKRLEMLTRGLLDRSGFGELEARCRAGLISAAALLRALTKPGDRRAVLDAHLAPLLV